jgi:hypothetical protein
VKTTIINTPAHRLDISLERSVHGTSLKLTTFVPHARRPEEQVKFHAILSDAELNILQKVLSEAVASATI